MPATIAEGVRAGILQRLAEVERSEQVRILLAIESGSRAWGFESQNSDYDVRFVYCRREPWYLSIDVEAKRDVLEYPIVDEIDLNGWDLRKALRLLRESNPTIVEWLQSPIEYASRGAFRSRALALLPEAYLPGKGIYHYRSMAKSAFRDFETEIAPARRAGSGCRKADHRRAIRHAVPRGAGGNVGG